MESSIAAILVCGSRGYPEHEMMAFRSVLDGWLRYVRAQGDRRPLVIEGGAPGPDTWARIWAHDNRVHVAHVDALWRAPAAAPAHTYRSGAEVAEQQLRVDIRVADPTAGPARNVMLAQLAVALNASAVAFWDGESWGTRHMIETLRQFGIVPTVHQPRPPVV
jgi:hypothetical protein